jgi:putative hydrolase of the HAD superfamily
MSIDTIIFDFGNVIAHFDYAIAAARLGEPIGLSGDQIMTRALSLGFRDLLMDFESGRIDRLAFLAELKLRLDLPQDLERIEADWADIFSANEPVHAMAHALKDKGYRLVLGSNTNAIHAAQFSKQFDPLLSRFDSLVYSHEVGAMKPSEKFYRRCVEVAGSTPSRCLFIDDMPENVQGARDCGLNALQYIDSSLLARHLEDLGIEVA